ncbi:hypothetical protein EGW08_006686, partial [Elysia chlorotica]
RAEVLRGHVARQVYVVVHMSGQIPAELRHGAARVLDELPLGHLVLDVWAAQVHRQHDEGEAEHKHRVWCKHANENKWLGVACAEPFREVLDHDGEGGPSLLRRRHFFEKLAQSVRQELVLEVLKLDQTLEDI